jgi:hypothetical protein
MIRSFVVLSLLTLAVFASYDPSQALEMAQASTIAYSSIN